MCSLDNLLVNYFTRCHFATMQQIAATCYDNSLRYCVVPGGMMAVPNTIQFCKLSIKNIGHWHRGCSRVFRQRLTASISS